MDEPRYPFEWDLSRPPTRLERLGFAASRWLGRLGGGILLLVLLFALVVGIPAWRVSGSDSYAAARRFVAEHELVHEDVGDVIGIDKVPIFYRVGQDRAEYRFMVRGEIAAGQASVTVDRSGGVWSVISADFAVTKAFRPGVHRKRVLLDGK